MTSSLRILAPTTGLGVALVQNLFRRNPKGNTLSSALSVSNCVGLVSAGAGGTNYGQISGALQLGSSDKQRNNLGYANQLAALSSGDLGVILQIANSLWVNGDFAFLPNYLQTAESYFKAQLFNRKFGAPETIPEMNGWVGDRTDQKITDLVEEIDPLSVAILLNAVNFEGEFQTMFPEHGTCHQPFYTPEGDKSHPLMSRNGEMRFYHNSDIMAVALPYGDRDDRVNQYVILPNKRTGRTLAEAVNSLSADVIAEIRQQRDTHEVDLTLPRFAAQMKEKLNEPLQDMGMTEAFEFGSDWSDMVPPGARIKLSEVTHICKIAVDEKGTKMQAATKAEMVLESCIMSGIQFNVNEPFITIGYDEETGTMLWGGVINNPEEIKDSGDASEASESAQEGEVLHDDGDIILE